MTTPTTHLLYDEEFRYLDLIDISDASLVRPIYMIVPNGVTHSFSVNDKDGNVLRIYHVSGNKSKVDLDEKCYILNKKIYNSDNFTINDLSFHAAFFIYYNQVKYSPDELSEYLNKFGYDDAMYIHNLWGCFYSIKYKYGEYNTNVILRKSKHILYGKEISDKAEEYIEYLKNIDIVNDYDKLTRELMTVSLSETDDYSLIVEKLKNCDDIQKYAIFCYYSKNHVTTRLEVIQPYRDIIMQFSYIQKYIYTKLLRG